MASGYDSQHQGHQKSKPSIFKSFVQRRQPSAEDAAHSPAPLDQNQQKHYQPSTADDNMGIGNFARNNPGALGELQHNQQESAPRSPRKSRDEQHQQPDDSRGRSRSPTKNAIGNIGKGTFKLAKSREVSPIKPKKTKSGTNLAGLLSRPKSLKNLYKMAVDEDTKKAKDKENRTPDESLDMAMPPPIFAQFTSDSSLRQQRDGRASVEVTRNASSQEYSAQQRPPVKERPWSYQVPPTQHELKTTASQPSWAKPSDEGLKDSKDEKSADKPTRTKGNIFASLGRNRSKSNASPAEPAPEQTLDPKDIDKHLEAMLNRRNIPENQRYKMRNLNNTIKMEFIRQDWAEMQAARPGTTDSVNSVDRTTAVASGSDCDEERPRRTRGKSFTFSRGQSRGRKENASPTKKPKGEGTLGRHFRSKSTDSVVSERERPLSSTGSSSTNLLAKMKLQQGPADYVAYLRKVQKPQLVEVGKLHKLRLLLRNETVAWIEDFIQQGGMKEIVGLLKRIMVVEWREEHEDALLHENLLCLKALSTTGRAMQYLHSIEADLFPKLLSMLFDPEKKGPSEFTTRNIITSVLYTYIESASPADRVTRAKSVLAHLRDPQPGEDKHPLPFILEMRQERPYRVWNKEVVSVTKEVFWIFLHNLNVVFLPSQKDQRPAEDDDPYSYMLRHFPQERPPVPAAPYVGGVEWDATNYIASHLDLMNAILACTPSTAERNALRAELRISGWERCLGGSLRLCKEKFYGGVHDGLRRWLSAAAEDGWDVRDVRYGPPPEAQSPSKKTPGGAQKKVEAPPKLDMPKLDFGGGKQSAQKDAWL